MSALNKLARMAKDFVRGYSNARRPGGLGTRAMGSQGSAYIEKPPIEPGQGIRRGLSRKAESLGFRSRLQESDLERLKRGPVPPAVGPIPPPPPGPLPPLPPEPGTGGNVPPPFPSGRRGDTDEWIAEYFRMRARRQTDQEEEYDDIETLGRSYDYDPDDFQRISQGMPILV